MLQKNLKLPTMQPTDPARVKYMSSSIFYGFLLIGCYKTFGSKYIDDDMYLTLVGSVGCIFGSLRFFWSMLLDFNYTFPQVYGVLVFLQLICSSTIFKAA
jgi:hypothetical protein